MNYNVYLLSQLLNKYVKEWRKMPYDEQYETVKELYKEFRETEFYNDLSISEYDAMLKWIEIKYKK